MKKYCLYSLFLILFSCSSQLYVPKQASGSNTVAQLNEGRELYVNHCASCHQLYLPNQYTATEWVINLEEMQARAHITDNQRKTIYQYLVNAPK